MLLANADSPDIVFRPAELCDCVTLSRLINRAYRPVSGEGGWTHEADWIAGERVSPDALAAVITKGGVLLATCEDFEGHELVGCVHIEMSDDLAVIGMLAVEPRAQTLGVGKRLMMQAEHAALMAGCSKARILVVNTRQTLVAFYERQGYCLTGNHSEYPKSSGVGTPKTPDALYLVEMLKPLSG